MAPNKKKIEKLIITTPNSRINSTAILKSIKKNRTTRNMSSIPPGDVASNSHPSLPVNNGSQISGPGGLVTVEILKTLLAENSLKVVNSVHQKIDQLNDLVKKQNVVISELKSEFVSIQNSNNHLRQENQFLWKEILRPNLVISGVVDKEEETREETWNNVYNLLKSVNKKEIDFDIAHRVGNFASNKRRPIKVKFFSIRQRNEIWTNRLAFKAPIFVNEDLPTATRRDHAILRGKKKSLISEGVDPKTIKIDWNKKKIIIGQKIIIVDDGKIQNLTETTRLSSTDQSRASHQFEHMDFDTSTSTQGNSQNDRFT